MQHIQKLESLGVLAGGIAHDFNNLLMAILGNANLASIELSPASKTREYLSEIEQATKRAADLCRQMLAYSGRGKFVIQKIHLPDIVAEMTQLLKASISKKASLNLDLSDRLPAMEGDPTQIRQVIMNLITNASEALADENGVISVSTGLAQCSLEYLRGIITDEDVHPGAYVYIEVSDTGCGMDETTRARMFEPFFTTKFTGRGLGMAAVLGIMRGHKGAITIDSVPEQGTTIRALFPAMDDIAPQGQPTSSETTESLKNTGGVLLVDDEESNRNIAGKMLNRLGFKVFLANDGSQALDEYRAHKAEIELVVLDLTMPNMDGEEAFRELRKMDPNIRVIISSGYTEQEIIRRFEGRNISGFIEKPYTLEALNNALKPLYGDERAE
jgi:CheY-like chemotaxis protein